MGYLQNGILFHHVYARAASCFLSTVAPRNETDESMAAVWDMITDIYRLFAEKPELLFAAKSGSFVPPDEPIETENGIHGMITYEEMLY